MSRQREPVAEAEARACCRVDLAGGTLDIWPLGLLHPGARTLSLAIDVEVTVKLRRRESSFRLRQDDHVREAAAAADLLDDPRTALLGLVLQALDLPPVDVEVVSESPRGAGLGASSALAVAFLAAGQRLLGLGSDEAATSARQRARLARDLEARLMGLPTGIQDHYPALLGGLLDIRHQPGGEQVESLDVDLRALGGCLLLFFTGVSHVSARQNWELVRGRLDGDPETVGLMAGIAEVAEQLPAAARAGDWARVGELVGREWGYRRHLSEGVSTPAIESLLDTARSLGAWGGKACGAGGGGCVLVLCPPERRELLAERLPVTGVTRLPASPSELPLRVKP